MAGTDSGSLVTPDALDPIAAMLARLMTPAARSTQTTTSTGGNTTESTVNNADTTALKALLAQLQTGSTPAGAADIIKQIFTTGTQQMAPGIKQAAAATGARAGTSSFQAMALNDMNARLAGQAAVELNRNVQTATQAATALAQVTQAPTVTRTTQPGVSTINKVDNNQFSLQNLLAPVAVGGIKTLFAEMLKPKTAANTVAAAEFLGPEATAALNFDSSNLLGSMNQGGSMTDFIINNAGAPAAGAAANVATISAPVAGDFVDFSGTAYSPTSSSGTGFSSGATSAGIDIAFNELMGGGTNSDTLGRAAVDFMSGGTTGIAAAAGNVLGIEEVGQVLDPVYSVAGDVVQGAGDVVSETYNSITKAAGTVICTEFNRQKILPDNLYAVYARRIHTINSITMRGYHAWAKPVVRAMQHGTWYSRALVAAAKPFVFGRVAHIRGDFSIAGLATVYIGEPVCYVIGRIAQAVAFCKGVINNG